MSTNDDLMKKLEELERKLDAISKAVGVPAPLKSAGGGALPRSVKRSGPSPRDMQF